MKHLFFSAGLALATAFTSHAQFTFTAPNTLGTPTPTSLRCDGVYGLRMDDGNTGNVEEATSVWCNSHTIDLSQSFVIDFDIRFGNVGTADGMTFTMQREGLTALERGGGYLGVTRGWGGAGATTPAVNVEFDLFNNGTTQGDIAADHVAISYNGVLNSPVAGPTAIPLVNNTWHHIVVAWDACDTTLVVTMDNNVIATLTDNLVDNVFGGTSTGVIFGFTSATWSNNTTHDLCFKDFQAFDCCENIPDPTVSLFSPVLCSSIGCCVGVNVTHGSTAPVSVIYDWGDGERSYTNIHEYDAPGTYTITVYAQYHLLDDPGSCCIKRVEQTVRMSCDLGGDSFEEGRISEGGSAEQTGLSELYPNPARSGEELTLKLAETPAAMVNFTLTSMDGKQIMTFQSSGTQMVTVRLPENLTNGLYVITADNPAIAPYKFYVNN